MKSLRNWGGTVKKNTDVEECVLEAMKDAEKKAWEALSRYKFLMFGYHAARWVNYYKLLGGRRANPFRDAVLLAREKLR